MVITLLEEEQSRSELVREVLGARGESIVGKLQVRLLAEGLRTYYNEPITRACGKSAVADGSFRIAPVVRDFFSIKKLICYDTGSGSRRQMRKARRKAMAGPYVAANYALGNLASKGLVEKSQERSWRLTRKGIKVARELCREVRKPTKAELRAKVLDAYRSRKARLEMGGGQMPMSLKEFIAEAFKTDALSDMPDGQKHEKRKRQTAREPPRWQQSG